MKPLLLVNKTMQYFVDNTLPCGMVLDRQANHGPLYDGDLISTATTGMGFIVTALAGSIQYRRLSHRAAIKRLRNGLHYALHDLPEDHGVMPHFLQTRNKEVVGSDSFSTIDSAWLVAGALWAASYTKDAKLISMADELYGRYDWHYWCDGGKLLRHGKDKHGAFLPYLWDRYSAETLFMYVLGAGIPENGFGPETMDALGAEESTAGGNKFLNADLGLFVHQYSLDLLNLEDFKSAKPDLYKSAAKATEANWQMCQVMRRPFMWDHDDPDRPTFLTFRYFWGLSAGDGPDGYKAYGTRLAAKDGHDATIEVDGTASVLATAASYAYAPRLVESNFFIETLGYRNMLGRYGPSNVNVDRGWVSPDVIGIDAGAAVIHLDNVLNGGRVRNVFTYAAPVQRGLQRLGFVRGEPKVKVAT